MAIWVKPEQPTPEHRSMTVVNVPTALFVHERLIWDEEMVEQLRFVGAAGAVKAPGTLSSGKKNTVLTRTSYRLGSHHSWSLCHIATGHPKQKTAGSLNGPRRLISIVFKLLY